MEIEITPTCVPNDAESLATGADAIRAYANSIHVDVTDGLFASAITWPYVRRGEFGEFNLTGTRGLTTEIHLMIQNPRALGVEFALAGAERSEEHTSELQSQSNLVCRL